MIGLVRRPDWRRRLVELANSRRLTPYRYGENDCWTFARAAVEAVTGVLLLPDLEPYRGWLGAAKLMVANGWESVETVMIEQLGPPVHIDASRPGDVVSYELGGELHLAVRMGDDAVTPGHECLEIVPKTQWRRGWKVG